MHSEGLKKMWIGNADAGWEDLRGAMTVNVSGTAWVKRK